MAGEATEDRATRLRTAVVLMAVGVILLGGQLTGQWQWVVPGLGLAFLATYLVTREYGFLVPGCILLGLGAGLLAHMRVPDPAEAANAGLLLVPLGLGFVGIWVLDRLYTRASNWWPLVPGGIIALVGLALWVGGAAVDLLALVGTWWPVILIAGGAVILVQLLREGQTGQQPPTPDEDELD